MSRCQIICRMSVEIRYITEVSSGSHQENHSSQKAMNRGTIVKHQKEQPFNLLRDQGGRLRNRNHGQYFGRWCLVQNRDVHVDCQVVILHLLKTCCPLHCGYSNKGRELEGRIGS